MEVALKSCWPADSENSSFLKCTGDSLHGEFILAGMGLHDASWLEGVLLIFSMRTQEVNDPF